jgi:hypothetical protein
MDNAKAKEILRLYRPGTTDALDPQMREALRAIENDPELARWFEQQCGVYIAVRGKLKQIEVPPDLKRNILLENAGRRKFILLSLNRPSIWLAAAAAVVFLVTGVWSVIPRNKGVDFAFFSDRMTGLVLRPTYPMTLHSTNIDEIRQDLQTKQLQANFVLPKGMQQLVPEGCGVGEWNKLRASMICFNAGRTDKGKLKELFLFVASRGDLQYVPSSKKPQLKRIHNTMTASWANGDKVYLLVASRTEPQLEQYLEE